MKLPSTTEYSRNFNDEEHHLLIAVYWHPSQDSGIFLTVFPVAKMKNSIKALYLEGPSDL